MDFFGLITKYPANRPLSEQERAHHLKQRHRLNAEPHYQFSVVKLNSTYLETVDKWFGWKGMLSALTLVVIVIFVALYLGLVHVSMTRAPDFRGETNDAFVLIAGAVMIFPFLAGVVWLQRKESFAYTHYPMRFNRKTRTVHVFRPNGTVLSVPWDQVFLRLGIWCNGMNGKFAATSWNQITRQSKRLSP